MRRPTSPPGNEFAAPMSGGAPRAQWVVVAALLVLVAAVFGQTGGHAFVGLDDDRLILHNPAVQDGLSVAGVRWAFATDVDAGRIPVTWLSRMLDVSLFGMNAAGHHLVNVLLHLLNALLLFHVLRTMTGRLRESALVAALFTVHPLHVESVAWVTERKDVLAGFFFLLSLGAYARYARRPGAGRYGLVALSFVLALLSKAIAVTLPFVLLLLDYWPLGRCSAGSAGRLFREKIPLLGLSAIAATVTYWSQARAGAVGTLDAIPLWARAGNAARAYAWYVAKTAWPSGLAAIYPHPGSDIVPWEAIAAAALIAAATALALSQRRVRPWIPVGWFWFLGILVPVIGLVTVGDQAMADRCTYLPLAGLFFAAAWSLPGAFAAPAARRIAAAALCAAVLALGAAAWNQTRFWRDSESLFARAVAVTAGNWKAWDGLGVAYAGTGRLRQAAGCYREAIRINPGYVNAWNNLGLACLGLGDIRQAAACFEEAARIDPRDAAAVHNAGLVHDRLGRTEAAIARYGDALRLKPDFAEAWNSLGAACARLGRFREAAGYFREALRLRPDYAEARRNLGLACERLGDPLQAEGHYREALRIKPDSAEAWNGLGTACAATGRLPEAIEAFRKALGLRPGFAEASNNLGVAYDELGRPELAVPRFEDALRIDPRNADAWNNLGVAHARLGRAGRAAECFREALRFRPDYAEARRNLETASGRPGGAR